MEDQVENRATEKRFGIVAVLTVAVCLLLVASALLIGKVYSPTAIVQTRESTKQNGTNNYAASYTVEGIYGKVSEDGKHFSFVDGNNSFDFDVVIWKDARGNTSWKHYMSGAVAVEIPEGAEVASVEFRQDGMLVTNFVGGQIKIENGVLNLRSLTQFDMDKDLEVIVNCGAEVFTYTFGLSQVECYVATTK